MFCKWCGKKLTNIGSPCPACGKNQDPLESGNGFWDLCSKEVAVQPVDAGMPIVIPAKENGATKTSKKNRKSHSSEVRRPAKRLCGGAWAVTVALLLITIIVTVIGVGKTEPEIYENTLVDFGRLIEENTLLMDDEVLNIEIYMIESTPAKCVYIAGGEMMENENAKVFWQRSVDQGETWETICEEVSHIIVEADETDAYRVVCAVTDDSEAVNLYYAAIIELEENTESQTDDAETDAGLATEDAAKADDTDETQPTGDNGNNNYDTTAPTEPEDGSVG